MTDAYRVTCEACGWSVEVRNGALMNSTPPGVSAQKRAAGHSSGKGCPYGKIHVERIE